jgi:hypothetical protein
MMRQQPYRMIFPTDYFAAREQFRIASQAAGFALQSLPIDAIGPQGDQLTIDAAFRPAQDGQPLLIISSGLHGVEGFFGSAVQIASLQRWQAKLPEGVGLLLLHALNPYGYAHLRRANEDNVDPNRNFLLADDAYQGTTKEYRLLNGLLNPPHPPTRWDLFAVRASWLLLRYGSRTMKQALATGQYDYPQGLFYGGSHPSQLVSILQEQLPAWFAGCSQTLHLDFHTGLGRGGEYKLLLTNALVEQQANWLRQHFGSRVCLAAEAEYLPRGDMGTWFQQQAKPGSYTYLCAEFGTYHALTMMSGLRAENQAHHWGEANSHSTRRSQQRLVELFCPAADSWRKRTTQQGGNLIQQALRALEAVHSFQTESS